MARGVVGSEGRGVGEEGGVVDESSLAETATLGEGGTVSGKKNQTLHY